MLACATWRVLRSRSSCDSAGGQLLGSAWVVADSNAATDVIRTAESIAARRAARRASPSALDTAAWGRWDADGRLGEVVVRRRILERQPERGIAGIRAAGRGGKIDCGHPQLGLHAGG